MDANAVMVSPGKKQKAVRGFLASNLGNEALEFVGEEKRVEFSFLRKKKCEVVGAAARAMTAFAESLAGCLFLEMSSRT